MYRIGDMILYGNTGVCKVADIIERKSPGGETGLYYMLKPVLGTCVIYSPVENTKVFMRPVITREEAERLIDRIPEIEPLQCDCASVRELTDFYETRMKSYDCADLLALSMSIYEKKSRLIANKKKVGVIDERFLRRAEDMLYSEFSVALEIPVGEVPGYIENRVSDILKEKNSVD